MGIAAAFVAMLIVLAVVAAVAYGTAIGLGRAGRFLWRLLVEPEEAEAAGTGLPCWQEKGCPAALRETCPAYVQRDGLPCWLANLKAEGRLRVNCLTCTRFSVADLVA